MDSFKLLIGIGLLLSQFAQGFLSSSNGAAFQKLHSSMKRTRNESMVNGGRLQYNGFAPSGQKVGKHQHSDMRTNNFIFGPLFASTSNRHNSGASPPPEDVDVTEKSLDLIAFQPAYTQKLVVVAFFAALSLGTFGCVELWFGPGQALLGTEFFLTICQRIFPIVFGLIFALVGVGHFVFVKNFSRIVPPKGTWGGLWQLPAPFSESLGIDYADYQSYLSGIFEFLGGIWLFAGGLGYTDPTRPGYFLFLLTIAVTPANLYMFTHDASPGGIVPKLTTTGHVSRFLLQCGLLSNFWIVSHPPTP